MPVAVQEARNSNSNTKVRSLAGIVPALIFILPSPVESLVNFTGKYISLDKSLNFVNLNFIGHIDAEN